MYNLAGGARGVRGGASGEDGHQGSSRRETQGGAIARSRLRLALTRTDIMIMRASGFCTLGAQTRGPDSDEHDAILQVPVDRYVDRYIEREVPVEIEKIIIQEVRAMPSESPPPVNSFLRYSSSKLNDDAAGDAFQS